MLRNHKTTYSFVVLSGKVVLVDHEDAHRLVELPWRYRAYGERGYAMCGVRRGGRRGKYNNIFLHRLITQPSTGFVVDHINGNSLDNRRCNLRIASPKDNSRNRTVKPKNKTGYRGVRMTNYGKFFASIGGRPNEIYLGVTDTAEEAALLFDYAAILLYGKFHGKLNFGG